MKFNVSEVSVSTRKKMEVLNVTGKISEIIEKSKIKNGLVNIWVPHATATIAVNEHDTDLWEDVLTAMERLVPTKADYRHNSKYGWNPLEQNAHAHILNCLIKPNVVIPLEEGKMQLGTWQSILFIEMDGPRTRSIYVQIIGE
ncbi:MAG: secondary thiamine-phosphate synthase enzyme YjbQ [Candidatus Bathyarchaeia archaeon]